jgi:site-specific recombinase XerD
MRDMKLGKHLLSQANGGYLIRFKGLELKVDRRHRQENKWEEPFPQRLLPALADWLTVWRPRIAPPECPYVFVTKGGKPWSDNNLAAAISKLTWQFTQHRPGGPIGTSPHMIRTIWRTEMCKAGMDIMTASRLLGDSIATIHKHYSHVDHRTPISQWTRDLVKAIVEGTD